MPQIVFENFFQGQLQGEPFVGSQNTAVQIANTSPHNSLGLLIPHGQLNDFTIPGLPNNGVPDVIVPVEFEKIYMFFGNTVYKYDAFLDTFSNIGTITSSTADAIYYNGYVYFSNGTNNEKLGRIDISTDTIDTSFATFLLTPSGSVNYMRKPMWVLNNQLYIGNEHYVALVDDTGFFVGDALDIEEQYRITTLANIGNELLIGTEGKQDNRGFRIQQSKLYRWNTWSETFSAEAFIPHGMCATFFQDNGDMFVVAIDPGAYIYQYSEPYPRKVSRIPSKGFFPRNPEPTPQVKHNKRVAHKGRDFFLLYDTTNNSYYSGLWSYHSAYPGLPRVLACEYGMPDGTVNEVPEQNLGTSVESAASYGGILYAGYSSNARDGVAQASENSSRDGKSIIQIPVVSVVREASKDFSIRVSYWSELAANNTDDDVTIEAYDGENSHFVEVRHDRQRRMFISQNAIPAKTLWVRISANNNETPVLIEKVIIDFP